ncbi:MAG: hypothetical protein GX369_02250 [Euryarchaeota archaeon]|nr:hypothetical protein [Euryarchaeota archaeon]
MTMIKCPICREQMSGEDREQLSDRFKEHMKSVHNMSEEGEFQRVGEQHIPPSDYSPDTMSLREAEGPVRESWKDDMRLWAAPPVPAQESGEDQREAMLHQDPIHPGTVLISHKDPDREIKMPSIECPMCGALIESPYEDDLSDDLRDHMADHHDIRSKRLAWISGRR